MKSTLIRQKTKRIFDDANANEDNSQVEMSQSKVWFNTFKLSEI